MRDFCKKAALVVLAWAPLLLHAAETDAPVAPPADAEIPMAPVRVDGETLFQVRGTSSFPAEQRASVIAGNIHAVARDSAIAPDQIAVVAGDLGPEIRAGSLRIMTVVPADAQLELLEPEILAAAHAQRIRLAVEQYRADRTPEKLTRGSVLSAIATALLALIAFGARTVYWRIEAALERRYRQRIQDLPVGSLQIVHGKQTWEVVTRGLRFTRLIVALLLLYFWAQFVLAQFPWSRWISAGLLQLLTDPLLQIGKGIIDYLPQLLFLIVLALVTRYGLRVLRLYFEAVSRGTLTVRHFEAEWALPSYKIARTLIIAIALVMAYPYLPGSGSEALKGISVFAGLLISLGASSSVANVIAGYLNTFGRVFKVGDVIEVAETRGVVTQIRLMSTRVRTIKNEEVTIPNATMLTNHVTNYSALAKSHGLVLHTSVGIGYETPWRQVHAMLIEAAARTAGLARDPPPFILQRQLGDFAVVYELNAHKDSALEMASTYSRLHQNILDIFNEHGVQIMTPAYEGDPQTPKVVPKEQWFAPPAKPPEAGPG